MLTARDVAAGLKLISTVCGQEPTKGMSGLWLAVHRQLSPQQFEAAILALIASTPSFFNAFPPPGSIAPYLARKIDPAAAELEGRRLWELVSRATVHRLKCGRLRSCSCTHSRWDAELISQHYGQAARLAFIAAGGDRALRNAEESDPFLVRRFAEAYAAEIQARPDAACPPALLATPERPLLSA
jgi:hypothetical protein